MEPIAIATTPDDITYVRAHYVTLDQLARGLGEHAWPGIHLPRATYALADGSLWYPRDWWRLHDDAGGVAGVRPLFARRLRASLRALGQAGDPECDVDDHWQSYLAGLCGACLRDVSPETIAIKEHFVARLDAARAAPRWDDPSWRTRVREDVDALDGLTRAFAACDRLRFGRPTSRDRLIDGLRAAAMLAS
jgi:hypothetical protein